MKPTIRTDAPSVADEHGRGVRGRNKWSAGRSAHESLCVSSRDPDGVSDPAYGWNHFSGVEAYGVTLWMLVDVFPNAAADHAGASAGDLLAAIDEREPELCERPRFGIGRSHRLTLYRLDEPNEREVSVTVPF